MRVSNVTVRRRLVWILIGGLLLYTTLLFRLGYLQLYQSQWLLGKAEDLWSRDIPIEPKRGRIYDRHGRLLAQNVSAPSVLAVPAQIREPAETARKLAAVLGMSEEKVYRLITKRQLMVRIQPEGRKITQEKAEAVRALRLPGIIVAEDSRRYYPRGAFAAHVLGFVGIDNQGLSGVEKVYDERLRGVPGYVSFYADAKGGIIPNQRQRYTPAKDGLDLVLTIDATIQAILERELEQAMLTYRAENVIGVAMDPKTGEILAMASMPEFDPGRFAQYPVEVYNRNLPIWRQFEPGSTFKIITLAAALEEGVVRLDEGFHDPGYAMVSGVRLRCWRRGGHGHQTFWEVVQNSCNPGFVELGERLGKERLYRYIRAFGFGERTGVDLVGEQRGQLFSLERMGPVELATTAFGQGVSVTPIQQVAAVSAAINGGKWMRPHVAKAWRDPETGRVVEEVKPEAVRQVISPETSKQVREALERVVAFGTGRNAYIDGYRVGGKTGTAQKPAPGGGYLQNEHIVSFIGFAPADDPRIVVYVAVDNPQGIQFGGVVAAPIVRNILDEALRYLEVPPRKEQLERTYLYGEEQWVTVPNFVGQSVEELRRSYYTFQLDVEGSGTTVLYQSPRPGVKVKPGAVIRLYLGPGGNASQPKTDDNPPAVH